jgi:hypothetical protein
MIAALATAGGEAAFGSLAEDEKGGGQGEAEEAEQQDGEESAQDVGEAIEPQPWRMCKGYSGE